MSPPVKEIYRSNALIDHSDPSGLYSYRRQPERVLFALDKLATTLYPLIGYEKLHGTAQAGFSEGKTSSDVKEWNAAAEESMKGWEEVFWDVEKLTERQGWQKASWARFEAICDTDPAVEIRTSDVPRLGRPGHLLRLPDHSADILGRL